MTAPPSSAAQQKMKAATIARSAMTGGAAARTSTPRSVGPSPSKPSIAPATDTGRHPGYSPAKPSVAVAVRTTLGTSPETRQARLNMLKNPTNPNLPGMHGPGGFAGTQQRSSLREQDAAVSMLGMNLTDRYGLPRDVARDFVTKAARTIAGEAAGESELGRSLVAKTMINRMDVGKTLPKAGPQYSTNPDNVLSAYDANGMRPGTQANQAYTEAVRGTPSFIGGLSALNKAMTPGVIPDNLSKFTHYRSTSMSPPDWEQGETFRTGNHVFSNADLGRDRIAKLQRQVDAGLPGDDMAGFQPASFSPRKLIQDRVPGATSEVVYSSSSRKPIQDRVPGATSEILYTPNPVSRKLIQDRVPGATSETVYTPPEVSGRGNPFQSDNDYTTVAFGRGNPFNPVRRDLEAMAGVRGVAGTGMGTFQSPDRYPTQSTMLPATTSPMSGQGLAWPVQGQETGWGDYTVSDQTATTLDNWGKIAQRNLDKKPVVTAEENGFWRLVEEGKKAAKDGYKTLTDKVESIPGDTPDEKAKVLEAYTKYGMLGALFASLGTGKPSTSKDYMGSPRDSNSSQKPRKKKRLPEDETATYSSDELLRRYFNGRKSV